MDRFPLPRESSARAERRKLGNRTTRKQARKATRFNKDRAPQPKSKQPAKAEGV